MINLSDYSLLPDERSAIEKLLSVVSRKPSLDALWNLMDQAWLAHGCQASAPNSDNIGHFYRDPVWLLNGMFIEQDEVSMNHRHAIARYVASLQPSQVLEFGGGFGTLARLMAVSTPIASIEICEPYPPRHGVESCKKYPNIKFIPSLKNASVDVLVCTDVLEHVADPIMLLASMVNAVKVGGYLIIANCFYPFILCHLPSTFHLRYSFDLFCRELGLDVLGPCVGSHATVYRRARAVDPDVPHLRRLEMRSRFLYVLRELKARYLSPVKAIAMRLVSGMSS